MTVFSEPTMARKRLIKDIFQEAKDGDDVRIDGWLRTKRDSRGGFSFLEINDGSMVGNLQIIADKDLENYDDEILHLGTGACLGVEGTLKKSEGKGQSLELQAKSILVHGLADESFPVQKKRHTFEHLRSIQHLRPRTNTLAAVLRLRSKLSFAIHCFFQEQDFHYINTPILTANDCEGAGEMFFVTSTNPYSSSQKILDPKNDFFAMPSYLTVSGQLEGEACALALGRIYTFGPTFRAENSNTSRHLAEFWMVEPEVAFNDLQDNADLAEAFLKYVIKYALDHCSPDLNFFNKWVDNSVLDRLELLYKKDFVRLTYTEAVEILKKADQKFEFPVEWGLDFQSEHEKYLTEKHIQGPAIVINYPRQIKSFYMKINDDGKTVGAMDVLVPGVGEVIGGSERENRYDILKARMIDQNLDTDEYSWYLDLRRYGSAPHSGFGLGFERLVQYISGMENIRDVAAFPRSPRHIRVDSSR